MATSKHAYDADTNGAGLFLSCYFHVTLGEKMHGNFAKCEGIEYELNMDTYSEGGKNTAPHLFPSDVIPKRLILERGIIEGDNLAVWLDTARTGVFKELTGKIDLRNEIGETIYSWDIEGAYPVKYSGPVFDAGESKFAVTRIEVMHKGILPSF